MIYGRWNGTHVHWWANAYSRGISVGVWRFSFMYRHIIKEYKGW